MTTMYTIFGIVCALTLLIITGINIFLNIKIDKLKREKQKIQQLVWDKNDEIGILKSMVDNYRYMWELEAGKTKEQENQIQDLQDQVQKLSQDTPETKNVEVVRINSIQPTDLMARVYVHDVQREETPKELFIPAVKDQIIDTLKPKLRDCLEIRECIADPLHPHLMPYMGRLRIFPDNKWESKKG